MTAPFQVLPTPPDAPLTVPTGERSAAMTFTEASLGSPSVITMRVARLPADVDFPTDNPAEDPTFLLSAGGQAAVIPAQPSKLSIMDQNGATAGTAEYFEETFDIYRIVLNVQRSGSRTWTLQIQNGDKQPRSFTGVVAGDDSDTRQPWINAVPTLDFQSDEGASAVLLGSIKIANNGTGALTLQPIGLEDPFSVIPPDDIGPNSSGVIQVQYDPSKSGPQVQTLTVASNDTLASAASLHNDVVTVSYRKTAPLPPPPPTGRPCSHPDGCKQYAPPRADPEGNCEHSYCNHPGSAHPLPF
ncbi:hypothetical protein [Mycobacterium sp.]|uniref:hypothetical protein n=1 Tax=Mycobacterium sp. TaxID=1785 RepID=UPI003BB000B6